MKIGIVSPYYMTSYGGVQTLIKYLQLHLLNRGHEVLIVAPRPRLKADIEKTPDNVTLLGVSVQINFKNPFHTSFPIATANRLMIADFLNSQQFDVLNIHEPWMPMLPYQILQEASCPIVGTTHARWPRSWFNKSLEKIRTPYFRSVLDKLDIITAVSPVAGYNVTFINDSKHKPVIIPNAIDIAHHQAQIETHKRLDPKPYILYLNRLEKRKGPRLLIQAYHQYLSQTISDPVPLIIAGTGPMAEVLKADVERYGLKDFVTFEGYVSEDRKYELFANARLYVSPAPFGESFGIVLLESMVADLPVVAGDNEGYRSVLKNQGRASLVDPHDIPKFASALEQFCNNETLRLAWQTWARSEIGNYDYPIITDQYEACFKKVVSKK
ncbi:MAG: glycosyltransferase family 4 protein [Candidatus Saccharibacteria bacterium]|nr:glycosyltransferase family 4 protein [Candidatus Saccharibacteria bacterium]